MYHTRIAPSPTGDMHIGTARTAYFNWLAARASGGTFTLRIDDTDAARSKPEHTQVILDAMAWLGLEYDSFVYQSQRRRRHQEALRDIAAFAQGVDDAVRLYWGHRPELPSSWYDEIAGDVPITDEDVAGMEGMVLLKSDGGSAYNWASVVDDWDMGINYIIRGTDHTTNTSKQVILWSLLGAPIPKLAHVGLIGVGGKKLSKRDGAASLLTYQKDGVDPDALLNFLARLGWGPKVDDKSTTLLPRERMLELFLGGGNLRNSAANADFQKLASFDRKYKAKKKRQFV